MEFLVLGPLRIMDNGQPVIVAAPRQRALLAALLIHANEVVSTDRLLDLVWGSEESDVGVSTLRYHVSEVARGRTLRSLTAEEGAAYSIESCPVEE